MDGKDIQAVEEVSAKLLVLNHGGQIAVRRSDQTGVGAKCTCASQSLELPLLKDPQELRLQLERNLPDLVQKHRSLMCQFEAPDALRDGSSKSASFVTKEFAFEEPGWDGSAIQLHEGVRAAWAEVVNRARDQFLASAGLAVNQHRGTGRGDRLDLAEDSAKGFATADDLFEALLGPDFIFEIQLLLRELVLEVGNLTIGQRIFHCDRHLARHLSKEIDILLSEGILRPSAKGHNAENAVPVDEWQQTAGLETLGQDCSRRGLAGHVRSGRHKRLARPEHLSRKRSLDRNKGFLLHESLAFREVKRVDP